MIGTTGGCHADPWREHPWANFVTDALRERAGAELCFHRSLVLLPALDAGAVTRRDLQECIRYSGDLVRMELPGAALRAICEHAVSDLPCDLHERVPPLFRLPGHSLLHSASPRGVRGGVRGSVGGGPGHDA